MVYERAIALELDMNICHPGVCASFHTQVVNRKLGPVDFCPPFITLLIVKVISLLEQFLSLRSWLATILRGLATETVLEKN